MYKLFFKSTTLLITVKDEEELSKRLIKYLNQQNLKINILIADGSKVNQAKLFQKLKNKYKYYYFGEDKNINKYYQKVYQSLKKIKTKFTFFCDQDDFINFECLKKKEEFLLKNPQFSSTKGLIYNFQNNKKNFLLAERCYPKEIFNYKMVFTRLKNNFHFRSYYCLHRNENLKKIYNLVTKNKINDVRSAEFVMDISTLLFGQVHLIYECSVLRCSDNKYVIHPIKKLQKSRLEWFFQKIFNNNQLLNSILNFNKNNNISLFSFKIIIILFDILPVYLRGKISILKNIFNRINQLINKNSITRKKFNINEINIIFNLLNKK